MRAPRVLILALVVALLGLLPTSAPVRAMPGNDSEDSATVAGKRTKWVGLRVVRAKNGKLYAKGSIRPKKRSKIVMERATRCVKKNKQTVCTFKKWKKFRTKRNGKYRLRIAAPKKGSWVWRSRVGKTHSNKTWLTCRLKPGQIKCPNPVKNRR